jgi:hypothetical protein
LWPDLDGCDDAKSSHVIELSFSREPNYRHGNLAEKIQYRQKQHESVSDPILPGFILDECFELTY